jgi:hypothetical protein
VQTEGAGITGPFSFPVYCPRAWPGGTPQALDRAAYDSATSAAEASESWLYWSTVKLALVDEVRLTTSSRVPAPSAISAHEWPVESESV